MIESWKKERKTIMPGPRKPITTIKEQVYQLIKDDICSGVYKPGQWLQESDLSARFEVSRSPIREALRQLVADGLVVEYPNRGVFVKEFTPKDIEDIFDLRILLESYAIMHSGQNLTAECAKKLMEHKDTLIRCHDENDLPKYTQADTLFHQFIIELGGNDLVVSVYEKVYSLVQQFRIYSLMTRQRFDDSLKEHIAIITPLLAGDAREADRLNRQHLIQAKEQILEYLSSQTKGQNPASDDRQR